MSGARLGSLSDHWSWQPVSALTPWVLLAGRSLLCDGCGAEEQVPATSDVGAYNCTIEAFLARHREHEGGETA